MRTIDFLVQELPKCGGWPEGAIGAGFLGYEGTLYFWDGDDCCPSKWMLDVCEEIEDHESEVSREQYEAAMAAKNGGWIEWGGGKCPVDDGEVVDVMFGRGGRISTNIAECWCWIHRGTSSDITAYRLHQPKKSEQAESDDEADLNECIGQDAAQVWDGEGKPTIGTKCEHHSGGQWEVVTIAGIHENLVTGFTDYWMVKEDGSSYTVGNPYRFRPVRSEADKKRDEAVTAMLSVFGSNAATGTTAALKAIYDAIAADEITGVKLED